LVRLSPRPLPEKLSFYYPEGEYYSYQNPVTASVAHRRGWRGAFIDSIRDSVLASKGYDVGRLSVLQRAFQPAFTTVFRYRIPYGFGWRFPDYIPGGRAVEIGCGSGTFLGLLKHHGWHVSGVELSARAAAFAKEQLGIDVFVGDVEDAPIEEKSIDYVHMSQVIEHLPNPLSALRTVSRLLKPGGIVYIETPNIDSFGRRRYGRDWLHWDSPRHLCLFNSKNIARTMDSAGLETRLIRSSVLTLKWSESYRQRRLSGVKPKEAPTGDPTELVDKGKWRARMLLGAAYANYLLDPSSGDNLHCIASPRQTRTVA
jgi:SAM-dependent methyltransferase